MKAYSLEDFYKQTSALIPEGISREIGHFNIFNIEEVHAQYKKKPFMPYNRRNYYKISVINGRNVAEYADKVIDIESTRCSLPRQKSPTTGSRRTISRQAISAFSLPIF